MREEVLPNERVAGTAREAGQRRLMLDAREVGSGRNAGTGRAGSCDRSAGLSRFGDVDFSELHDYQKEGVTWLREHPNGLLGDDLGLGKSVQALRALPRHARAVVVCPASVIMSWAEQIERWRKDLSPTYGESLRLPREGEVLIVSYDALPDLREHTSLLVDDPMRDVFLILDECQMVMTDDALRTRKVRRLRVQCGSCWGLSATPMYGDPEDLWGVLVSLGLADVYQDRRSFIQMCGGKERWIYDKRQGRKRRAGYVWGEVSPEVRERLYRVMLRRKADDVLKDLPEVQTIDVPVEAPEDLKKFLNEVSDKWKELDLDPDELPPFELLSEARAALARSRRHAAAEFVNNAASEELPVLVFSAHVDPVLEVGKLRGAGHFIGGESLKEKNRLVKDFQAGKIRILAMTIQTGGAGLNLQAAGGVFFVDRDYTPSMNMQALGRARRQGNIKKRVVCWRMISDHPLDKRLQEILDEKERVISAAVG